jgi:hypothetical protein
MELARAERLRGDVKPMVMTVKNDDSQFRAAGLGSD